MGAVLFLRLREGTWEDIEDAETNKLPSVVEEYAPGTHGALRDMYIQSPPRKEEKHKMPHKKVMHVEMIVDQMFMHRPLPELSRYQAPLQVSSLPVPVCTQAAEYSAHRATPAPTL